MKKEIHSLKSKLYQDFIAKKKKPIYNPKKFKVFCESAGAIYLFDHIMESITDTRHSHNKIMLNELRVVSMIYKMCYSH
jgi:hypothetical protein